MDGVRYGESEYGILASESFYPLKIKFIIVYSVITADG